MATAFSENEKEIIKKKLKQTAIECLSKYGVKKTTIDQLVKIAGISKGAFYLFYESKEILFFKVMEDYQNRIMNEVIEGLQSEEKLNRKKFAELLYGIYQNVKSSFLIPMLQNQEIEYLFRKLPEELLIQHQTFDNTMAENMILYANVKEDIRVEVISASLRAIFMSMLHVKEIGETEFDHVLKLLISGLVNQIIDED